MFAKMCYEIHLYQDLGLFLFKLKYYLDNPIRTIDNHNSNINGVEIIINMYDGFGRIYK